MCLRSTLCLWIAIAVLVQKSTFVCAQNCNCLCNRKRICPEILSLKTDIHSNIAVLNSLKPNVEHSKNLWEKFNYEFQDWKEKIEKKMDSFEGLKERLDEAESRAVRLETDLENSRKDFEKELLHNTSKRFSEVHKQYEELKDDFDSKLLNMENYTKLWKSDIVEGKSAWNISEDDAETLSNMVSTLRMNDRVFQMAISDVKKRLLGVESEIENFKPAIEAEKQAREELEEKLQGNFSTSAAALQYSEVRKNFSSLEDGLRNLDQRLSLGTLDIYHFKEEVRDIYRRMSELESAFRNVQNDIVELDIKVSQITDKSESHSGRDGLRSRRELERRLTEVRKYRSTAENKATPPETEIPME